MAVTLSLENISKAFDGFTALQQASLAAEQGKVHALLGENGAGKSTLMNVACGLYAPDSGSLSVDGAEVRLAGPRQAAALGIGMVHQHFKLVRSFTVAENVLMTNQGPTIGIAFRRGLHAANEAIRASAATLGVELDPSRRIDSLSVAEQQRVEVIKALIAGARILILDEPTAMLTDLDAERLLLSLRELAGNGATIILVTHKLSDVKRYADCVTVMRGGRSIASIDPADISIAELTRLTVGDTVGGLKPQQQTFGRRRLEVLNLTCRRSDGRLAVSDVSFHVRAGEIYGIAGVSGNGQSDLAEALMGLRPADAGLIQFEDVGEGVPYASPNRIRGLGTALIPADRYAYALAGDLSVADNYAIGQVSSGRHGSWLWMRPHSMHAETRKAIAVFDVQGVRTLSQKAALLSGGNAQKLVLARELGPAPEIIVAQSPSRGLDARASSAVHNQLLQASQRGAAVLLISEDLDEVLKLSDRIGVMNSGKLVSEFDAPADRQRIGRAMVDDV